MRLAAFAALILTVATPALSDAPVASPRPTSRPAQSAAVAGPSAQAAVAPADGVVLSTRPVRKPREAGLAVIAAAAVPARPGKPGARGAVCGDPALGGVGVPPIPGKARGCGLENGVRITSVSGVPLSQPLTVDCATAKALRQWVDTGIRPAVGSAGGGLARLEVGASYTCRPRNNQKGNKISEHGRGRAIDLHGIRLANGTEISVLNGWTRAPRIMKAIHASACGPFGTVLGPRSDRFHKDHFHVDTARYRGGNYCK